MPKYPCQFRTCLALETLELGPYITRVVGEECETWQRRRSVAREDLALPGHPVQQGDVLKIWVDVALSSR